jgi:DNA (cytosine-5)-methyltransferase 1
MVKVLDLYCGIGGFSLGVGASLRNSNVCGFDIDNNAVLIYNHNLARFGYKAYVKDLVNAPMSEVCDIAGDIDIIIGGPPCQPFSLLTNVQAKNFVGERHKLYPTFKRYFDYVSKLHPIAFIMENVEGLIINYRYLLVEQISKIEGQYNIMMKVFDMSYYGVPQRRRRIIVIGVRSDYSRIGGKIDIPKINDVITVKDLLEDNVKVLLIRKGKKRKWYGGENYIINTITKGSISSGNIRLYKGGVEIRESLDFFKLVQTFPRWWDFSIVSENTAKELLGECVPPVFAFKLGYWLGKYLGLEVNLPSKDIFQLPYFEKSFSEFCGIYGGGGSGCPE